MAEYSLKNLKTTYVEQKLIKANKRSFRDTIRIKLIIFIDLFQYFSVFCYTQDGLSVYAASTSEPNTVQQFLHRCL